VTIRSAGRGGTELLDKLPQVFTYAQARTAGVGHRALYGWRDTGQIEVVGRGLFRKAEDDLVDLTWVGVATRAPRATLCLTSALAYHDLSDAIPAAKDLALPRGDRSPRVTGPISWHTFDAERFEIGREIHEVEDTIHMGVYNAERSIVDTFRLRHRQGEDEAHEALRRWIRKPGSQPSTLLELAGHFPRSVTAIRKALAVLL
jgi:predicted transcriptional regulator of viral defense system